LVEPPGGLTLVVVAPAFAYETRVTTPATPAAVPPTPDAVALGPDGEAAALVLDLSGNPRPARLVLFSGCLRIHQGGAMEELALDGVTHASVSLKKPLAGLAVALVMGGVAFLNLGAADAGAELVFAVLLGVMGAFHGLTHLSGGILELRVGPRILAFPLPAGAVASAVALASGIHRHKPTTARPVLTIPRLIEDALTDLFSSDRQLAQRLTQRLKLQGTAGEPELLPNALRVTRRMAAWNAGFALGVPLLALGVMQGLWPTPALASLLRAVVVTPVAVVLGLVLQGRLLPRFKGWLVS
jgi:hypothetical protein